MHARAQVFPLDAPSMPAHVVQLIQMASNQSSNNRSSSHMIYLDRPEHCVAAPIAPARPLHPEVGQHCATHHTPRCEPRQGHEPLGSLTQGL